MTPQKLYRYNASKACWDFIKILDDATAQLELLAYRQQNPNDFYRVALKPPFGMPNKPGVKKR